MTENDHKAFVESLKVHDFTPEKQDEIAAKYREQSANPSEGNTEEEGIGQRERELGKNGESNSSSQDQNQEQEQENDYDYGYGY